jgi:hypothetical protein
MEEDGIFLYKNKVYVPNSLKFRNLILKEMHNVPYTRHARYQKIITSIRCQYYWLGMKKDMADFVARCMECEKVKVEHKHP